MDLKEREKVRLPWLRDFKCAWCKRMFTTSYDHKLNGTKPKCMRDDCMEKYNERKRLLK